MIAGIDLKSYESLAGQPFHYHQRRPVSGSKRRFGGRPVRPAKHVKVGDTIEILNHNFRVAGIVEEGRGARKFLQIETLQDLIGAKAKRQCFI